MIFEFQLNQIITQSQVDQLIDSFIDSNTMSSSLYYFMIKAYWFALIVHLYFPSLCSYFLKVFLYMVMMSSFPF